MSVTFRRSSGDLSVSFLRERHPAWTWRAVRHGVGWRYEGYRSDQKVTVQMYVSHYGSFEDDMVVQWRVWETGETYAEWATREGYNDAE